MRKHLSFFITFSLHKYSKAWFYFSPSEDMVNRTLISQQRHICTFLSLWEAVALKKCNRFPFIPLHLIFEITSQKYLSEHQAKVNYFEVLVIPYNIEINLITHTLARDYLFYIFCDCFDVFFTACVCTSGGEYTHSL